MLRSQFEFYAHVGMGRGTKKNRNKTHFYTGKKGDCICLQLSRSAVHKLDIVTKFEEPKPLGQTEVEETWNWICPYISCVIPTGFLGLSQVCMKYNVMRR